VDLRLGLDYSPFWEKVLEQKMVRYKYDIIKSPDNN